MTIIYYKSQDGFKNLDINIWSGNLQKDESMIWSYSEQKGFFQKHFTKTYAVTNFRIFAYDHEISKMIGLLLLSELDDIVVTDTYRTFSSIRYGGYGYGISGGASKGESVTIGKITFMSKGAPVISLNGVSDPSGLKRLTLSVKKALYPTKELQRWMTGIKSDDPSIVRNVLICLRCGTRNKDANYCSSCGSILK